MTTFFIPGVGDDPQVVERAYVEMRKQVELELGHEPSSRRILSLWSRRGSMDCVTEVGVSDPLRGGTVMAIFDLGAHQPFVVWWQPDGRMPDTIREVLGHSAYAVVEFES